MATNFFFNNFQNSQEQLLIEDLVIESIKVYGLDMYYIPRVTVDKDVIFNEDPERKYEQALAVEMYIKNVDGFQGEGDFLSKFNIQIRDQITFTIAQRIFNSEVGQVKNFLRPREGDLIFLPLNKKIFEIKFVEHEAIFYQMGSLQTFDLKCELFEYNNEKFDTGISDVDYLETRYAQKQTVTVVSATGGFTIGETITQNTGSVSVTAEVVQVNQATVNGYANAAVLSVIRFNNGSSDDITKFKVNTAITGLTSNTTATVYDPGTIVIELDQTDDFQTEASDFLDFTQADPFSEGNY